ncbi:MAG: hypothetical protein MR436_01930 [Eubacterium sp.]|nr:hypothetical protein [Eubacterium sp.]
MYATKLWLAENLHLQTSDEKSGITNLRKNYTTFLGIKFKVVPKGNRWIIRSHIADKSRDKVIKKLKEVWKDIKNPSKQSEIDRNISLYNAMVMGMHNYYCMATMVSADFAEIAFKVTGKSNGMNHNDRCYPIERQGEITSKFIQEKYGQSKQFRWIKGRMIIPIGYVAHEYPKYKRREVNKYVRKYSDVENCISFDVMKYMMENAHLYPTMEMADNALSRYIAQKGKCAVTHNALTISDMVCVHIKPWHGERNDTYRNLIILSKEVSDLVGATKTTTIMKLLSNLVLTEEMQNKVNKLRKFRELEEIQFEDYIGTKK